MTSSEEKQIDDYLILNRLPLDILLEVRDHMISQVSDLQIRENLSFEKAFFKTKIAWEPEFKMTNYSIFYFEAIPVIFKKIAKLKYINILKKALLVAVTSFLFNLCFIYVSSNAETFKMIFKIQNSFFIFLPIFLIVYNYKIWKHIKADYKYEGKIFFSMYQKNIGLMLVGISTMTQMVTANGSAYTYLFFKGNNHVAIVAFLIMLISPFLLQTLLVFGIINFLEHKKTLEKIQNFIKVSEAN